MSGEVHIVTCGISLLRNFAKQLSQSSLLGKHPDLKKQLEENSDNFIKSLDDREKTELKSEMLEYLKRDGRKASAEINSIFGYIEDIKNANISEIGNIIKEVHLLRSDTESGKIVADVLGDYLHSLGLNISIHSVEGFGSGDFNSAVRNLVEIARSIVKRKKNVVLNLTGGYKAEIAAMAVLASESDLKQYYIHEGSRKAVMIPRASELKVRMTKWDKIIGFLATLMNIPLHLPPDYPELIVKSIILAVVFYILAKKA